MTKIPKLKIYRCRKTEAVAFAFVTHQILINFYRNQGFYVLPEYVNSDCSILYPRIIPNMPALFKYTILNETDVLNATSDFISLIIDKIPFDRSKTHQVENQITKYFNCIWTELSNIVPDIIKDVSTVEIYPTQLGSICFEYSSFLETNDTVKLFPRFDCELPEIIKMLIISLLLKNNSKYGYDWNERMMVAEFVINHSALNNVLITQTNVLKHLNDINKAQLKNWSDKYLTELGFVTYNDLSIKQGDVYINEQIILLSVKENLVLKLLIENHGKVVSYEMIARVLWQNDWVNKFSLEAIVQVVKRIRAGLGKYGINRNVIQSVNKRGYVIEN